ncbi:MULTISPECIES: Na+/H+ antiporter NhaA [unclassified Polaribacter]|jgi:NhaA family Na+:H+ antiporter|uniref:Na+/H+ antiporter NhaA n=1 Tax=unclassified Polaribacter TaxID=196858 RepID=UPI001C4FB96D|nr:MULTISPECIES: Na+/H+ antiporter NhaA [unclassified Polaribacter]QXP63530.1 Na+/H+ antiporter NhaA [Polaribacter sp. HaHaR_3_91]QXP66038.1 Na+/H+ antiporter NhaA [Polaribacter sp. AHE13PA]QXP71526.1 Na+/H+ antiporter NhaA [Polaribacter sp. R2A056_3_33]
MIKKLFITPFQKFVKIESFSGILLLICTLVALFWANSPLHESYSSILEYKVGFSGENFELKKSVLFWINDGLMAIFFFLIGLEIKREILIGELNTVKKLAFPLFGAVGGALIPVGLFMLLNQNPETFKGWGIPMATDIAFSLAVLNTLGKRIPLSLKIFLTAFAIVDDIEAVLVIAVFYSESIEVALLLIGLGLIALLYVLTNRGYYSKFVMIFVGIIVWVLFLKSGVHPTVAGILIAFSVPIRQEIKTTTFLSQLEGIYNSIKTAPVLKEPILSNQQLKLVDNLTHWSKKFQSPLQHLEHNLHNWSAYFIIPVFALANAGVLIDSSVHIDMALVFHIILCLVLGKGLGIPLVILVAKKLNLIQIPADIHFIQILGVSFIAGIGFTMAIFIAGLAFSTSPEFISSAKIGILLGSLISAIIGYLILRFAPVKDFIKL